MSKQLFLITMPHMRNILERVCAPGGFEVNVAMYRVFRTVLAVVLAFWYSKIKK